MNAVQAAQAELANSTSNTNNNNNTNNINNNLNNNNNVNSSGDLAFGGVVGQPSVTLTIRLIMQGKEVGSIIGKKGDNIKRFREESGAKITISDGSCPERIVTVTGSTDSILKAFAMIARKFEEDANNTNLLMGSNFNLSNTGTPTTMASSTALSGSITSQNGQNKSLSLPVTLKLIVPASQCGSLIGKGGSKIKEIREITNASIQVASEMLPNSTERAVTLSGTAESITKSIYQICCVMLESPPKGPTIPYRPKPAMPPVFFAGGQAYTIQGQFAIPHPDLTKLHRLALQHVPLLPGQAVGTINPQATLATLANPASTMGHHTSANPTTGMVATLTAEMTISNDIIGSVIGKGGSKINEIRQLSGATIKINSSEEGTKDRTITISGTPEAINLAQYLIATSRNGLWNTMPTPGTLMSSANANHSATLSAAGASNSLSMASSVGKLYSTGGTVSKHGLNSMSSISNGSTTKSNKNDRKYAPYRLDG